ncbi:hypothetical protein LPJ61_004124 [Coemansia biformis]|uniref:PAS domain-containing protein n=1 Tax=Coemansia biformis TaxID=1286918 RepID=A0A9W7YB89_9FUNG|nr:hypothetical protein LPJ61_004124 [Coemansia biformis]
MCEDSEVTSRDTGAEAQRPSPPTSRPTYLGILARDESTRSLYVSSGCLRSLGFTPAYVMAQRARDMVACESSIDGFVRAYACKKDVEGGGDDEADAYVMYMNVKTASGLPVLARYTTFPCDSCILYVCMTFPEAAAALVHDGPQIHATLDGAAKRASASALDSESRTASRRKQANASHVPLYSARSKQLKAAFVLENSGTGRTRPTDPACGWAGPLVVFVTGSLARLVDADASDMIHEPFLKLVAPEDVLRVGKFFDRLSSSTDVMFETFSLLSRPYLIEGDIATPDKDNQRVVVECLGAAVPDGAALLLRKLCVESAPKRDAAGNYIRSYVHDIDKSNSYISLSELVSSDPETSDAPSWSQLY